MAVYIIRFFKFSMGLILGLFALLLSIWSTFHAFDIFIADENLSACLKIARYLLVLPLPVLWFMAVMQYTRRIKRFNIYLRVLFSILPLLVLLLFFGGEQFPEVFIRGLHLSSKNEDAFSLASRIGSLCFSNILILAGAFFLCAFSKRIYKALPYQLFFLVAVPLVFIVSDILYRFELFPSCVYHFVPLFLSFCSVIVLIGVFRYRIYDLAPLARDMIMDGISDIIVLADGKGRIVECNRAAVDFFSIEDVDCITHTLKDFHPLLGKIHDQEQMIALGSGEVVLEKEGKPHYFHYFAKPVFFRKESIAGMLVQLRDITDHMRFQEEIQKANAELKEKIFRIEQLKDRLKEEVIRDPLTGIYNRRYMDQLISRDLALAGRNNTSLSFAVLDIDFFKAVNDNWGHQAGDALLKNLSAIMVSKVRMSDLLFRIGGEEFLLLLNGVSLDKAAEIVEEIRHAFENSKTPYQDIEIRATLSAGVSSYPENHKNQTDLVRLADEALYLAKRQGRNRVVISSTASVES